MEPKYNLWIEVDGEVILSQWRILLLESIERHGSISAAADEMEVPYRRAWERLHEMEDRLGEALLETEVGGPHGGGAVLTNSAKTLINRFNRFSHGFDDYVRKRFGDAFPLKSNEEEVRK
jgi:molybdate transport system regulatory protein